MIIKQLHEMSGGGYSGHSIMDSMLVRTAPTANEVIDEIMAEEQKLILGLVTTYEQRALSAATFGDPNLLESPLMMALGNKTQQGYDAISAYARQHGVSTEVAVVHLAAVQLSVALGVSAATSVAQLYRHSVEKAMATRNHVKFDDLWLEIANRTMRIPPCQPMPLPTATADTNFTND